jgi:crossover junction endodeoxyribonuclease RusA
VSEAESRRLAAVGGVLYPGVVQDLPRPAVRLTVYGQPAPQGSKRAFSGKRKDGSTYSGVIESSHDRVKSWREAVKAAGLEDVSYRRGAGELRPLNGPLTVVMVFSLRRPQSHYGTGRNARTLKATAPARPAKAPDLSKLCRATEDALEEVGLLDNDSLIVEYARLAKVWCGEDPDALGVPGAVITIRQVT